MSRYDAWILLLTAGLFAVALWNGTNNAESLNIAKETQRLIKDKEGDQ